VCLKFSCKLTNQQGKEVSDAQLQKLVRGLWRAKLKEFGVIDTNSTKNWKKLLSEVRRGLLTARISAVGSECCTTLNESKEHHTFQGFELLRT
jgi:hypothetical protein